MVSVAIRRPLKGGFTILNNFHFSTTTSTDKEIKRRRKCEQVQVAGQVIKERVSLHGYT
jgi:hypothetical protein